MIASQMVGVRTYQTSGTDPYGEPVESWSAPVDTPVYGWGPATTDEPFEAGHQIVEWELDLYVPPGFTVGARDLVVVLGVDYQVHGVVESFEYGPFSFRPGARVRLKRVEG